MSVCVWRAQTVPSVWSSKCTFCNCRSLSGYMQFFSIHLLSTGNFHYSISFRRFTEIVCVRSKTMQKSIETGLSVSFQFVSGFSFFYYSNDSYLGQLNRRRLNFSSFNFISCRKSICFVTFYLRSSHSSVGSLTSEIRKFLFAQKRVPHDDQFLYFFVNVKFQVKLRGIVRTAKYMQWARHRAVHLRMKQKQLKTKRTCSKFGRRSKWHTHTARCQNNEYFTLNANILCVPVFIIKKFPSAPSMKCYFLPRLLWLQWSNRINSYRAWGNVHFFFFFCANIPSGKKHVHIPLGATYVIINNKRLKPATCVRQMTMTIVDTKSHCLAHSREIANFVQCASRE